MPWTLFFTNCLVCNIIQDISTGIGFRREKGSLLKQACCSPSFSQCCRIKKGFRSYMFHKASYVFIHVVTHLREVFPGFISLFSFQFPACNLIEVQTLEYRWLSSEIESVQIHSVGV